MGNVNQIYSIVNATAKQSMGKSAIEVTDTSTLVALGDAVLSSDTSRDKFVGALVDRIGKTVYGVRRYRATGNNNIVKEPFEYGCILQKINVKLPEARENKSWEIGAGDYKPEFAPVIKPTVRQKLFDKISTWEVAVTIPDRILKTAFLNGTAMAVFIDAIFTAMDNMVEVALENNVNLTKASFIARKLSGKNEFPCTAVDLLTQYNTLTNAELTIESALRNKEFYQWAGNQILLWVSRLRRMSTLFNNEGYERFTPQENLVVDILDSFATGSNTYLQSDVYHNELTKLPKYNEVNYWQGSGLTFNFDDTSSISVKLSESVTVTQKGIIGMAYDEEAIGVTIDNRKMTSERNNHDEYTNYYSKFDIGYFNDMSENGIIFYMTES